MNNDLKARAAYLRGLLQGVDLAQNSKEKMVWEGLIDFCEVVADDLDELSNSQDEFADYIEAIDEDLSVLEKQFYSIEDEEQGDSDIIFTNEVDDDDTVIEISCPNCHEELYFTDEAGEYEVVCPECNQVVWSHTVEDNGPTVYRDKDLL